MIEGSDTAGTARPQRILWLVMGSEGYGVRRITGVMWTYLRRRDVQVHVVSVREGQIVQDARSIVGATSTLETELTKQHVKRARRVRFLRNITYASRHALTLRRMLRSEDIELLQLSDIDLVPLARLAAFRTNARVCYLTPNSPPVHRFARLLFPLLLRGRSIRVLANSDDIRDRFARAGVTSDTLRLGVDLDDFAMQPMQGCAGTTQFIIAARICRAKAQDLWIDAFCEILRRRYDVRLVIAGGDVDPTFAEAVRQKIALSGYANRFELLGNRSDVPDLLAASHVALCGQRKVEPFGLSAVEALATGRPIVVLGDGGIREIVRDGQSGWLAPAVDVKSLVDTLERCLRDSDRWSEMGAVGRADMEGRFSAARVVDDYLMLNSGSPAR